MEAFALEQDVDASLIVSNSFQMEWPPRSGRQQSFPEIDRACWYTLAEASVMMLASQLLGAWPRSSGSMAPTPEVRLG